MLLGRMWAMVKLLGDSASPYTPMTVQLPLLGEYCGVECWSPNPGTAMD